MEHPRAGGERVAGGQVDDGEEPAAAAVRAVQERTGYPTRLLPPLLPDDRPDQPVPAAWHVVSRPAAADSRRGEGPVHRDHLFVGVTDRPLVPHPASEHATHWVTRAGLGDRDLPRDTLDLSAALFEGIARAAALRPRPSRNEELRGELLRRQEEDQAVRLVPASERTPQLLERWRAVDEGNTAWLNTVIGSHGWPGEALVGSDGASAAWLFAQHADRQPDFQGECLTLLAAAVTAGDADPRHGALLEDRVLVAAGLPQLFGTQLTQGPGGRLVPLPLRDAAEVDNLRAAWHFDPLDQYVRQLTDQQQGQGRA
ncbi:DUF6624 domain-containing protein [Streptomyces sp. NBC_01264]|uniref:DUF6624 domain-containing protein n=1 Tax=Streptomyces sp. NBC_01264 TaxID=2903804 RepID=UPI0022563C3B|nr:DUF6624 domain-containing protein [Streptomyces sp. NBC_01264]MCX4784095.1 NUDIX domain-containing protein [Streptomyces sp. NBC_01264]